MDRLYLLPLFALLGVGCHREPVREWAPTDHDQAEGTPPPSTDLTKTQVQLVQVSWDRQCARCHGSDGQGEGQAGFKSPDLTRTEWQNQTSDEQIVTAIRDGKGLMPRFDLPPAIIAGLVKHIRQFRKP